LLRDQRERLDVLREGRRTLLEELERESQERRQFMGHLEEANPHVMENLGCGSQARIEHGREVERLEEEQLRLIEEVEQQRAEELKHEREEQSRVQQDADRLGQEHLQLMEDLETEREQRLVT
jgi:hypothetical protein